MDFGEDEGVTNLIKHDLGNIHSIVSGYLGLSQYIPDDGEEEELVKSFSKDLDDALEALDSGSYGKARSKMEDILRYDLVGFPDFYEDHVADAQDLANIGQDCVGIEYDKDYKGWIRISEVFENLDDTKVEYNDSKNSYLRGDVSLKCIVNTLEENAHRHGGEDVDVNVDIKLADEDDSGEYLVPGWGDEVGEYELGHWISSDAEYEILFWDDGEGLSNDLSEDEVFERGVGSNSGNGLYLTRKIIEFFDGDVNLIDEEKYTEVSDDMGFGLSINLPGKKIRARGF